MGNTESIVSYKAYHIILTCGISTNHIGDSFNFIHSHYRARVFCALLPIFLNEATLTSANSVSLLYIWNVAFSACSTRRAFYTNEK